MFTHLISFLIITLCWQHIASRHIAQQPFYPPYSDYSYTYSGPGPYHQSFQHHQSPFYSPPGTYFDQRQGILRPFPGGGVPVLVDYHKRCSDNFVGLRAHPDQQQYYYVCKPDCVIFGKCQNLQIFNATSSQCAQHPPPEYIPTCTSVGRFPLFSDCHLYFKCEEDLRPKIYSCPTSMVFSPAAKKCINGNKCTHTQISPQSFYLPEICANKFPPCFENGIFRSPSDCSLYYKCDLKKNGVYMQTRLKCPDGSFYDLQKKMCLPAKEVACDCIQVAELVYPNPNTLPFQPPVYPAQFDLESMIDGQYPVEKANDTVAETNNNCNAKSSEIVVDSQAVGTTTLSPFDLNNELMKPNDLESTILSDYVDEVEQGAQSIEDDELTPMPVGFANSSEETASTAEAGSETELPKSQALTVNEDNLTAATTAKTEEITESATTVTTDKQATDEPPALAEEQEVLSQSLDTADIAKETEPKEQDRTITIKDSLPSLEPVACEDEGTGDTDTQTKKCLTIHTPTNINTNTDSMELAHNSKIQNEQNSRTFVTTTPHIPTTNLKTTTEDMITTQIPNETVTAIPDRDKLEENLLDSALRLETAGTAQSSEKTVTEIAQVTRPPETDVEKLERQDPKTPSQDASLFTQTHSINKNSLEPDISYEDLLESEIRKKPKAELLEDSNENLDNEISTNRPASKNLESLDLQETAEAITIPADSTTEQSTDVPTNGANDKPAVLDSEINIDDFATTIKPQENLNESFLSLAENATDPLTQSQQENISVNEKFVTLRQVDFRNENFIPVRSRHSKLNGIEEENLVSAKGFDDDYTTILAENELTTTLASTIPIEIFPKSDKHNEITVFDKITTIKRRQTSLDEDIQTTTQISVVAETLANFTEQPRSGRTEDESPLVNREKESDGFGVLDSEIVVPAHANEGSATEEEVSNNEITSAETIQKTSNSNQPKIPLSHSPTTKSVTPTTQIPITKTTTSEPSEKQTNSFTLHIRNEDLDRSPTLDSSPPRKSLYYILKTKPVINNSKNSNENTTNNEIVTATQDTGPGRREIPRLEIIAERPIDIHFSICPSSCDKDHKPNKLTTGKRAVLLKWFAKKSKQTLGFETANGINAGDV